MNKYGKRSDNKKEKSSSRMSRKFNKNSVSRLIKGSKSDHKSIESRKSQWRLKGSKKSLSSARKWAENGWTKKSQIKRQKATRSTTLCRKSLLRGKYWAGRRDWVKTGQMKRKIKKWCFQGQDKSKQCTSNQTSSRKAWYSSCFHHTATSKNRSQRAVGQFHPTTSSSFSTKTNPWSKS